MIVPRLGSADSCFSAGAAAAASCWSAVAPLRRLDGWMAEWLDCCMVGVAGKLDGWITGWVPGWLDGLAANAKAKAKAKAEAKPKPKPKAKAKAKARDRRVRGAE